MRTATIATAVAGLGLLAGCQWLDQFKPKPKPTTPAQPDGPVGPATSAELVGYLNTQAGYLNSVRYPDVYVDVYVGKDHYTLADSTLMCAKPRNFLMSGGKRITGELINIGSNDQEFWMLTRGPLPQEYVFCSHADFQRGSAQLPFPFDPDWALQALGMTTFDPGLPYKVDTDKKTRVHYLTMDATTPGRAPVKRVIVFAADQKGGTEPQVRRHLILDQSENVIAVADVKQVTTVPVASDSTGKPAYVQVPTAVSLEWPQQQFKMELRLNRPTVNENLSEAESARLFSRPAANGVTPINLAEARYAPTTRGATPEEGRRRLFGGR